LQASGPPSERSAATLRRTERQLNVSAKATKIDCEIAGLFSQQDAKMVGLIVTPSPQA